MADGSPRGTQERARMNPNSSRRTASSRKWIHDDSRPPLIRVNSCPFVVATAFPRLFSRAPLRTRSLRWTQWIGLTLLLGVLAGGCGKAKMEKKTRSITAAGITYTVPVEKETHGENLQGFSYKGESVSVSESALQLTVDEREYGAIKTGDRVSLLEKGKVYVNGVERKPL